MGFMIKATDTALAIFLLVFGLMAPLDAGLVFKAPSELFIHLKGWYLRKFGSDLVNQKPAYFVALLWVELLFQWPLGVLLFYGILCQKRWIYNICLLFGSSYVTAMVALTVEVISTHGVSSRMTVGSILFICFGILTILRGMLQHSNIETGAAIGPKLREKKRA